MKYEPTTLALALLLTSSISFAQQGKVSPAKKKVTLGDLLQKVKEENRGANLNQVQKNNVAIPKTQITFEQRVVVNLNEVKPPKLSEIYSYENNEQAAYEKTLDLQIAELYKLTQKFKDSNNRGELWLRLAELYVEKSNVVDGRNQNEYDRKLNDFEAGRTKVKPILDTVAAKEYNKKAIQLYDWFLRDFPNDSKVPQALFFLGYNNFELGNTVAGTKYYDQLTTNFPNSVFTGEAHFALGENLFEGEKWADAYKEYGFLIKDSKHSLHMIALYKAAWCLFRLGRTEDGIKYLDFIVKSAQSSKTSNSFNGKKINTARLENESLKDLVVFFTDVGDTKRAISYFRAVNTKESKDCIEKMAYYLSDKGNREGSRDVFNYLISQDPNSKKAFEYQYQIVQNYFFAKNSPEFKSELYKWIVNYNVKSSWYAIHKKDQAFIIKSNQLREQTLRNYVLQQHQTAQNSHASFSQQSADEAYKLYFQEFSNSTAAADMHFFYGELLYDMARFDEAATQYAIVSENFPTSTYAEKALQNILLALEKVLPKDEELQRRVGNSTSPIAMDERVQKFIKSANLYLQRYPKSDRAAEIKFRVGRLYYLTNNFDPAEKEFKEIVQSYPKTKFSEYSANLLLDIYSLKKDYAGLEKMGSQLLTNDAIANGKLGQDIRGVMEKASFKKAQSLEIDKKYLESATQYQTFSVQNPASDLAGIAAFNAAVNFERSGKYKEAMNNYKKVIESNNVAVTNLKPKSKRLLAKLYQDAGLFEESGVLYRQMATEHPEDPQRANYVYNAAVMFEITGKTTEAVSQYNNYLKLNKNRSENADVIFKIADLARESSKAEEAYEGYKKYINLPEFKADQKIEAYYWMYQLAQKRAVKLDLAYTQAKIQGLLAAVPANQKEASNAFLAKLKMIQANDMYAKLKAIRIPNSPAQQKVAIDKKLGAMGTLNDQLGSIIKLDSAEEIVSALYILGESNEHMASALRAVPIPSKLNDEQKKMYQVEVDKIVTPFANKADESYKLTVERGMDLQVYPEAYDKAYEKLSRKYPKDYYLSGEVVSESKKIDWIGDK
jgi:cellulose synthase operon protein C